MANGKIRFGKQSGGELSLVIPDGVGNTEVIVPESGKLATEDYVDNNSFNQTSTIATGTATFTATTNNINLTGIGIGVEIGDVIQISGAEDTKNNSEFTIEVITDDDNIIVNQAHANKGTSKNVYTRAGDTEVTVKLLAKWYNAPNGLGQGWVDVTAIRTVGTNYQNFTNRKIYASITSIATANGGNANVIQSILSGTVTNGATCESGWRASGNLGIDINGIYRYSTNSVGTIVIHECR